MRYWQGDELLAPTHDLRFRRLVLRRDRMRAATLSFAPGGVEEHAHPGSDEVFFVVSGRGRIAVEGSIVRMGAGDLLYVEAGEWHAILADGDDENFVIFAVVSPDLGDDSVFSGAPFPIG
jgi:mannose-6-phosphate isomerase-like protein (cupin superfamily)